MGADIHVYLEKKTDEKYNIWESVCLYKIDEYRHKLEIANPYNGRNGELFSALAGVRGWLTPFVNPRGLPENLSQEIEKEYLWFKGDAHTSTWYDVYELKLLIKEFKMEHKEDFEYKNIVVALDYFYNNLISYLKFAGEEPFGSEIGKYRVIIWFDN